jgi:hypothetical protein
MPREHQGVSASLIATIVNYSISLGLGLGVTVEVHVNDGGKDILRGYRGAWYLATGLSRLGIVLAMFYGLQRIAEGRDENRLQMKINPHQDLYKILDPVA